MCHIIYSKTKIKHLFYLPQSHFFKGKKKKYTKKMIVLKIIKKLPLILCLKSCKKKKNYLSTDPYFQDVKFKSRQIVQYMYHVIFYHDSTCTYK